MNIKGHPNKNDSPIQDNNDSEIEKSKIYVAALTITGFLVFIILVLFILNSCSIRPGGWGA
jgi:hypothetical protein